MEHASRPLWNRDFLSYWFGLAATALADAGIYVALPFLVLAAGGGSETLATVLVLGTAPRFLGPVIGTLADRVPLRWPVAAAAASRGVLFAVLGLVALRGDLPLGWIFAAAPLNGLLTLFVFSAGNVALPHLVAREQLGRANGLVQGATMGLPLVGLGAAGAAVAAFGPAAVICGAAPLFLVLMGAAARIRFPAVDPETRATPVLADLKRGVGFLAGRTPLLLLLVSSFVLNAALNALNVTVPILMERNGRGAAGFGWFESLISAGILIGILVVATSGSRWRSRTQIAASQILFAGGFGIMAMGGLAATYVGGAVLGIGLGIGEVAILTLVQLAVPDGIRGKVLGVAFTANAAGLTSGAWVAGQALAVTSETTIFGVAAILGAGLCALWIGLQALAPKALDRLVSTGTMATGGD